MSTRLTNWGVVDELGYCASAQHRKSELPDKIASEEFKKKRSKPIMRKISGKGLFSKVGVEPTFYPSIKAPDSWIEDERWDDLFHKIVEHFTEYNRDHRIHPWFNKMYNDASNLEVPTYKPYVSLSKLTRDFDKLVKVLNINGFKPSSVIEPYSDGGCHINFDLTEKHKKYGERITESFWKNVAGFLNQYPTSVWGFLHFNDTESSQIYTGYLSDYSDTKKGYCLNIPVSSQHSDCYRIEMRGFSMPRSTEEFVFHIDYCNKLLKHVWNKCCERPGELIFSILNAEYDLRRYTWLKAKDEFTSLLQTLKVDIKQAKKFGKFNMIKKRIEHGNSYLT